MLVDRDDDDDEEFESQRTSDAVDDVTTTAATYGVDEEPSSLPPGVEVAEEETGRRGLDGMRPPSLYPLPTGDEALDSEASVAAAAPRRPTVRKRMLRRTMAAWSRLAPFVLPLVPQRNFFWGHLTYMVSMALLGGLIIWAQEPIGYLDALFVSASAVCITGLSSVDFSAFSTGSQVVVMVWILLGGFVTLSVVPLLVRLAFFHFRRQDPDDTDEPMYEAALPQTERILWLLVGVIAGYWLVVQLSAFIIMGAYLSTSESAARVLRDNGDYNPWFWSLFHTISGFQNAGFGLFASSLVPFADNQVVTLTLSFLMASGATLFPVLLRWLLSTVHRFAATQQLKDDTGELLRNPRSYYYLLFSRRNTWILVGAWLAITLVEYCLFFVEWNRPVVYGQRFPASIKLMINFFQTVALRICGYNNVNVGALNYGHLAFFIFSMYMSAFPFAISVRTSNRSHKQPGVTDQARHLLGRDIVWIYFTVTVIAFIEFHHRPEDPAIVPNSFLSLVFEVVSAFGTIGLSMGFPGKNYSFCGSFTGVSKFIIMVCFIAGRHRWLPESIDHAVTPVRRSLDRPPRSRLQRRLRRRRVDEEAQPSTNSMATIQVT